MFASANPKRFLDLTAPYEPWLWGLASLLIAIGLWQALLVAPPDYQQGESVRIMFVHVPSAWMAMFVYAVIAGASLVSLVFRHPIADVAAKAAAPIGAVFTLVTLATGSLWGKPMWGTWWEWDARMTSVLVLFFLYLGYIALWQAIEEPTRAARAAAVLALVGAVNLPIIKFSVDWWRTLHQPASVFRMDGPTMHPAFLWPLAIMALGFMVLFTALLLLRMRTEVMERRLRAQRLAAAGD
ncbi:MAG: heme transporter HemC [Alphaproteobacteria bacterium]|nr:heme transporter HemC [Alphaproteobacteria bacterium]